MSNHQRGQIRKITFEIEYPDGSKKTSVIDSPISIAYIAFDDSSISAQDLDKFNASATDWQQNPAMLVYPKAGSAAIPFCTHNGCSSLDVSAS